jgi:hypothetical protein
MGATTETKPTEPATGKTLWKNGAGVGAAVASALGTLIAVGLGGSQPPPADPTGYLIPVAAVAAFALVGALCGAIVGCAVPVIETKTDSTATH